VGSKPGLDALNNLGGVSQLKAELFHACRAPRHSLPKVETVRGEGAIFGIPNLPHFKRRLQPVWAVVTQNRSWLVGLKQGSAPKALISDLSESLLTSFAQAALLDKYDLYQRLMTYWNRYVQDDVYLVTSDGCWGKQAKTDGGRPQDQREADLRITAEAENRPDPAGADRGALFCR